MENNGLDCELDANGTMRPPRDMRTGSTFAPLRDEEYEQYADVSKEYRDVKARGGTFCSQAGEVDDAQNLRKYVQHVQEGIDGTKRASRTSPVPEKIQNRKMLIDGMVEALMSNVRRPESKAMALAAAQLAAHTQMQFLSNDEFIKKHESVGTDHRIKRMVERRKREQNANANSIIACLDYLRRLNGQELRITVEGVIDQAGMFHKVQIETGEGKAKCKSTDRSKARVSALQGRKK